MARKQLNFFTKEDFPWANLRKFAEFWIADSFQRRRIVRSIKYPPPRKHQDKKVFDKRGVWGFVFATIKEYHNGPSDPDRLLKVARELEIEASKLEGQKAAYRLRNARAIRDYAQHFADMIFIPLLDQEFILRASDVTIKVVPDLTIIDNEGIKLLKYFFAQKQRRHDSKLFRKICDLIFAAQLEKGMGLAPENIMHLDVSKGSIMRGMETGYDLNKELKKVAHTYKQIWESTKNPNK